MLEIIIPIIFVSLIVIILSVISKKKNKVDKGFKFNYFGLSYRRKMIRTLVNLPVFVLLLFVIHYFTDWGIPTIVLWGLLFLIAFIIQLIYNYTMWKRLET
ncbi:ATPase [Sporosarcina sp. FA9]|uniref:ATPase n=1 Tax=Sporosarcina sp. FA9 TaxID=3413030 RepID=UPI003F65F112